MIKKIKKIMKAKNYQKKLIVYLMMRRYNILKNRYFQIKTIIIISIIIIVIKIIITILATIIIVIIISIIIIISILIIVLVIIMIVMLIIIQIKLILKGMKMMEKKNHLQLKRQS